MSHDFYWEDPDNLKTLQGLEKLSKDFDISMAQIALAWLLVNPAVTSPIVGASNIQQLEKNLSAVEINLSESDLERIDEIAPPKGPYIT